MKLTRIIYLYTILFCSCNVFNSTPLDDIYALAGTNAKELKKVIAYFSKDERLSLQLESKYPPPPINSTSDLCRSFGRLRRLYIDQ